MAKQYRDAVGPWRAFLPIMDHEKPRRHAPRMTRLGLVGGLGPESTIDYYCRILDGWKATDPATSPSIVIDSLDVRARSISSRRIARR